MGLGGRGCVGLFISSNLEQLWFFFWQFLVGCGKPKYTKLISDQFQPIRNNFDFLSTLFFVPNLGGWVLGQKIQKLFTTNLLAISANLWQLWLFKILTSSGGGSQKYFTHISSICVNCSWHDKFSFLEGLHVAQFIISWLFRVGGRVGRLFENKTKLSQLC